MMRAMTAILCMTTVGGCMFGPSTNRHALIDDLTNASEYRVVAVDGSSVRRSASSIHTAAPIVEVEPGTRSLTLQHPDSDDETRTVTGNFEAGKTYLVTLQDGEPSVREFPSQD